MNYCIYITIFTLYWGYIYAKHREWRLRDKWFDAFSLSFFLAVVWPLSTGFYLGKIMRHYLANPYV